MQQNDNTLKWSEKTATCTNHRCQDLKEPARTVLKSWASSPKESHVIDRDTKRVRKLTWQEIAILQSFDPSWFVAPVARKRKRKEEEEESTTTAACLDITDAQKIMLIGNAVPPRFAHALFRVCYPLIEKKTSLELFAGGGGLSLGAQLAGLDHLGFYDFEEYATKVLKYHYPEHLVHTVDICKTQFDSYKGKVGILSGGPPCQPFSISGLNSKGKDDDREMFKEMARILSQVEPEIFILENVSGLIGPRHKPYFLEIIKQFENLGFYVQYELFNVIYYGVPQDRKRLLTIGSKNKEIVQTIFTTLRAESPEWYKSSTIRTVEDAMKKADTPNVFPWRDIVYPNTV